MKKTIKLIVMAALCLNFSAKSQEPIAPKPLKNQGILGKVISVSTGEALSGAVIKISNTKQTLLTNNRGEFILSLPNGSYNLSVSSLSHKTKSISIQIPLKEPLHIELETDDNSLKEVEINAGYYTVKDKERTGSISRVTAETIGKQPVSNPLQALQGRMTGVIVTQTTGAPGGGINIQIRGQNSLRNTSGDNGNIPYYIVDGVPYPPVSLGSGAGTTIVDIMSPLNSINPSDIESIEVLKDADATAIYGSRGANGVILITTKKGKTDHNAIQIDLYSGAGKIGKMMELLDTKQYLEMRREAFANDNIIPTALTAPDLVLWDTTRYTNWQKKLIGGTMHKSNFNASISGGNTKTSFMIGGNYYRETTVYPANFAYQKASSRININHKANERFSVSLTTSIGIDANNIIAEDLIVNAINLPPNAPYIYKGDGSLNWENSTWTNPMAVLNRTYNANTTNIIANGSLNYVVLPNLQLKVNLGTNKLQLEEKRLAPLSSYDPNSAATGNSRFANGSDRGWIVEPVANFKTTIKSHQLNVLLGVTFQYNRKDTEYLSGTGYTNDALLTDLKSAPTFSVLASNATQYKYNAVFARLNYDFNSKYFINLTARRDGSSRFGPGKSFGNFGAVGVAWLFSEESWIKSIPAISLGKIRMSYGITGNDQIPDYGYLNTYIASTAYQGTSLIPNRLANPDYAWETNRKFEAALQLEFLNSRIAAEFGWYKNRSSNQLVGYTLSTVTGFPSVQSNLPAVVQNTGFEIMINGTLLSSKSISWKADFNLTLPRNKLIDYPNIALSSYNNTYTVGLSLFQPKKNNYIGVDPASGVYKFQDRTGDGIGTGTADRSGLKFIGKKMYGGLHNNVRICDWEVDFFLQFVKQNGASYMNSASFLAPGFLNNQPEIVMNRWQNSESNGAQVQKFTQSTSSAAYTAYNASRSSGDNVITDASYLRLQNLAISRRLPVEWTNRLKIKSCHLFLQGQNLLTFTNYVGYDPENLTASNLPPLKVLTFGIRLTL